MLLNTNAFEKYFLIFNAALAKISSAAYLFLLFFKKHIRRAARRFLCNVTKTKIRLAFFSKMC